MSDNFTGFLRASLKSSVAILPLAIMVAQMPANAQSKTREQLEAEAAAAKAAIGSEADDARAIAELTGGMTGGSSSTTNAKDIVVVGTNIRGVAPTGTNVVSMSREDIAATGQTSGTALLAQLPQLGDFNSIAEPTTTANGFMNRPNARGLPDNSLDTGPSTLVLIDGNRTSGVGGRQNITDLDAIPLATLERVEVNTDGGSAVSGSDAIGGVINFVSRRTYNGVEVSGKYGYADDYGIYDASIIVGKSWSKGGFWFSLQRGGNKALLNGDRDWYKVIDWRTGLQSGTACELANVIFPATTATSSTTFTAPARYYGAIADGTLRRNSNLNVPTLGDPTTITAQTNGQPNLCTNGRNASLDPARLRNNANITITYDFSDSLLFKVTGRYADSKTHFVNAPPTFSVRIAPENPFYQAITATPGYTRLSNTGVSTTTSDAGLAQTVSGSYQPAVGLDFLPNINKFHQYGATAELIWKIDGNFQAKFTGIWDQSRTTTRTRQANATFRDSTINPQTLNPVTANPNNRACSDASTTWFALPAGAAKNAALAAAKLVCINPYNIASSDPALIEKIFSAETGINTEDRIYNSKVVVDGSLFDIPGGKVKASFGAEYFEEKIMKQGAPFTGSPKGFVDTMEKGYGTRALWSAFAELSVPLVSTANSLTWIKELRVRAAARYDHYSFFGSTFNPQLGVTFRPTNWLIMSGNVSTTYRAPTVLDLLGNTVGIPVLVGVYADNRISKNTNLPDPESCAAGGGCLTNAITLSLNGGAASDIGPQTGFNWSLKGEIRPFRGFSASVNYYHIDYMDAISAPNALQFSSFSPFATWYPTEAQINEFLSVTNDPNLRATETRPVYALIDLRARNYGNNKIGGLDYTVKYNTRTPWGSVFFSVNGNKKLISKSQGATTQTINGVPTLVIVNAFSDTLGNSTHGVTIQGGITYGQGLRVSATLRHSDGYKVDRSNASPQDEVAAFNVLDTFFSYNFTTDGPIESGLTLTLSINNILNTPPPLRMSGSGTANGRTIGRLVQVGFTKKF